MVVVGGSEGKVVVGRKVVGDMIVVVDGVFVGELAVVVGGMMVDSGSVVVENVQIVVGRSGVVVVVGEFLVVVSAHFRLHSHTPQRLHTTA